MARNRVAAVLLPMFAAVVGLVALPAVSVAAPAEVTVQRIFGADRFETSAAIARVTFGTSTTPVGKAVIANGSDFADAAVGANLLFGYFGPGPVLLTRAHDVPQPILDVVRQLGIRQPEIIGGTAAVDKSVEQALQTLVEVYPSGEVGRFSGSDRYATGAAVAKAAFDGEANWPGLVDGLRTAFLVSGVGGSDALAAAPLTYAARIPLLLTQPDVLSVPTRDALLTISGGNRPIQQVIVIGGPGVVGPAVLSQVKALGISTRRIAGADRQATAVAVANFAVLTLGWNSAHVNLARGDDFADATSAAPHAGQELAPLLFTASPDQLGTATADFLRAHAGITQSIDMLGGPAAVSDSVVAEARIAAGG